MVGFAAHVHISEREQAHLWPDGQPDDARWEDCAFDTAVEWARVTHDPRIPATHVEAEALRAASGLGPSGGATIDRVRAGLTARYGFAGTKAVGFAALWAALVPGTAACAQGSMGAFPLGHSLRRWLPSFAGIHQVTAFRLDAVDRVWWCDPLAPAGAYTGEWVSKAQLAAYINAFAANGHTVAPLQEEAMTTITLTPFDPPPRASFAGGKTYLGYDPLTLALSGKVTIGPAGSGALCAGGAIIVPAPAWAPGGKVWKIANGALAGRYVAQAGITPAPAPPPPAPGFTQAQLDAARLEGRVAGIKAARDDLADLK